MAQKSKPTNSPPTEAEVRAALKSLAKKGVIVDSGRKRWSERSGRYEIVWVSAVIGKTLH
jgi:hypothetical protein